MKRWADLSKMVSLTLSPSEAKDVVLALETFQRVAAAVGGDRASGLDETIERIHLQLEDLLWPMEERRRAPYPV